MKHLELPSKAMLMLSRSFFFSGMGGSVAPGIQGTHRG